MAAKYTDELKAQVIAEWEAGGSLQMLATAHGLPKSTVQAFVQGRTRTAVVRKTSEAMGEIDAMAWDLVRNGFAASAAILRKAQDPEWLHKQNAADLGVFYGIVQDKNLRFLAAFRVDDDTEADSEQASIAG